MLQQTMVLLPLKNIRFFNGVNITAIEVNNTTMTDKSSHRYKSTSEADGPDYESHPDQGCDKSRGRKCEDCIYTECLEDNTVKNKVRRWIDLPLGEGEYLYCKDCGKQLYGTRSPVKDAPREPAWLWVQVYTNPFALKDTKDIVQLVVCEDCKKEEV